MTHHENLVDASGEQVTPRWRLPVQDQIAALEAQGRRVAYYDDGTPMVTSYGEVRYIPDSADEMLEDSDGDYS